MCMKCNLLACVLLTIMTSPLLGVTFKNKTNQTIEIYILLANEEGFGVSSVPLKIARGQEKFFDGSAFECWVGGCRYSFYKVSDTTIIEIDSDEGVVFQGKGSIY